MIIRCKRDNTKDTSNAFDVSAVFINQGISDAQYKAIDLGIAVRQKDLNKMTVNAIKRIGVPNEKAMLKSFTEIVRRALNEQFIEPLFVDEGSICRYSYEYVHKVHMIRQISIKEMTNKARCMNEIIEKIKIVYQSILKDDFAFQFRNDDELASKLLVQDKFYELKDKLIADLDKLN